MALHLRQGAYADSWHVQSLIPEAGLVKGFGDRALVSLKYRYYGQSAADFYSRRYESPVPIRSGDTRLGGVREHHPTLKLEWQLWGRSGGFSSGRVSAEYSLSLMEYVSTGVTARGHIVGLALQAAY